MSKAGSPQQPNAQDIGQLLALLKDNRLGEAITVAKAMAARFPLHLSGWRALAQAYWLMGRPADALVPCQKVAALTPGDADAHNNLGIMLKNLGRLNEAEASFRLALKINPDSGIANSNLGNILVDQGRLVEAVSAYQRALLATPQSAETHNNLGNALKEMGRLDEARASYEQALAINPDYSDARLNLGTIQSLIVGRNSSQAFFSGGKPGLQGVRKQYEYLPFPPRDPQAERHVLWVSLPDILGKINQYCFAGNRDYSKPFRVLVAGCGTGDSVIWLAHQLKDTKAEIVALDFSLASLEIAQARAKVRGLANIQCINRSLLEVSELGLQPFDYISCLGVLHHLPDPAEGLAALESVLAEGGAMAIMLYGAVGRAHLYVLQRALSRLSAGLDDPGERLAFAKAIVANLPATNAFRRLEGVNRIRGQYLLDDTNFWDTLLHEQDRAYTASQVREFLGSAGLCLQAFISYQGVQAISSLQYDLDLYIDDESQRERLKALSLSERQDIAEALDGSLALHTVYATRSPQSSLSPMAPDAILSPMSNSAQRIVAYLAESDQALNVTLSNGIAFSYNPSVVTRAFFARIDGHRSNSEIARLLGIREDSEELGLVNREFRVPTALHWLIARTGAGSYVPPLADRGILSFPLYHYEPTSLPL